MNTGYEGILQFRGKWRDYQERVLLHAQQYLKDGKIHIVAAPGSGKTTLGIELIRRLGAPCLIFSPSITIRQQWLMRIHEGFLTEEADPQEYYPII
ncbi:DEAD/DEAH box helicase family protein [Roseburia sp. AF25-25LB]|uniref:DEAD/DEAH box helicase family protein n=1 Tax=Roseburia sp. AF25-25LB TaxID=2293135 RepID=UPI002110A939|nr:DEAD/DEAH box helicase family protein [Roseburia sp. AF25-25LB]